MSKFVIRAALCLFLAACAPGSGSPPVINKSPYRVIPAQTAAQKGDSVYSIAWRFGLDPEKLFKWNGLGKRANIRPGQRLRLRAPGSSKLPAQPPAQPSAQPTLVAKTGQKPAAQPKPAQPKKRTPSATSGATASASGRWGWPAMGKLISRFSRNKGRNGIQIAGASGSAIRSTAAGEVVYAGEGLRGYGKLIIVKHSPAYLSAYAHNRKIMVAEGERINSGQQIAQMGNSGTDRTMLHFEIRKDGKPVDPLKFLN